MVAMKLWDESRAKRRMCTPEIKTKNVPAPVKKEETKEKQKKVKCTSRIDMLGSDYSHGEGSDDSEATPELDCNASKSTCNAAKKGARKIKAKNKPRVHVGTEDSSEDEQYGVKMVTNYRVVGQKAKQIQYQLQWESENEAGIPFATFVTRGMWENDLSQTLGWKVHYNRPCLSKKEIEARFLELDRAREQHEAGQHKKKTQKRSRGRGAHTR